jgi:hypothetical protein
MEVTKCLGGIGKLPTNRLLIYQGLKMAFVELKVNRNPERDWFGSVFGKE